MKKLSTKISFKIDYQKLYEMSNWKRGVFETKKLIGYFKSVLWISEEKQNEETITNKLSQNTEGRGFK